jgi:hypothetical protein
MPPYADGYENALILDTTNLDPAYLEYYVVDTNWINNLSYGPPGSVLFFFAPDWASCSQGGTGPGETAYFLWCGDTSTNGLFAIYTDQYGSNIYFGGVNNGVSSIYASAPISWTSNSWHQIGVEWWGSRSRIYLDGALAASGRRMSIVPWMGTDTNGFYTNGFFIGSDNQGYEQARGAFWDMMTWSVEYGGYYIDGWSTLSNNLVAWQTASGFSFGRTMDTSAGFGYVPGVAYTTNYADYTNFNMTIGPSNSPTQVVFTVQNTQSNLTYNILTNSTLDPNLADWGVWQTLTASNSVIVAPPFNLGSNSMFFASQLVLITGTNQIADWWQMLYFHQLGIDPYADPDGDGLCNYSEYILGTNPTNAYSISPTHNDAQAMFLAYTNDATTRLRLFQTNGPGTNEVTLTLSNTSVGSNYQIYSKDMSVANSAWRVETNLLGTNNATQITIQLAGRTLEFIGGDGEDPDGDSLPSGYEVLCTLTDPLLADTGNTGTPDGYKDPDGDGYVNLEEYYNGTDPHVFNPPQGVPNISADFVTGPNGNMIVTWQAASGPVLGYIISSNLVVVATNTASQLTYVDTSPTAGEDTIGVQAIYAGGLSSVVYGGGITVDPSYATPVVLVNGPGGIPCLVIPNLNMDLAAIQVSLTSDGGVGYPVDSYPSQRYRQTLTTIYPGFGVVNTFQVPISRFTNGVAQLTQSEVPPYGDYYALFWSISKTGRMSWNYDEYACYYFAMPFLDATTQMKQNIAFQLRVADSGPFQYYLCDSNGYTDFTYPTSYAYSDYFCTLEYNGQYGLYWNQFEPVEDNYFFRNLVFNTNQIGTNGYLTTGFQTEDDYTPMYEAYGPLTFNFPTYSYVLYSNNAPVPALLAASNTQWIGYYDVGDLARLGLPFSSSTGVRFQTNLFGLPYNSELATIDGSPVQYFIITNGYPGGGNFGPPYYMSAVQPTLRTIGYYFARDNVDPTPGYQDGSFTTCSTTPSPILGSVGKTMYIAGYAQQAILNGYTNVFAYLGQYFTNAFVMSNGVLTATSAGIVSEYGGFFPILPGHIGLMTKPDPDQWNMQGTCEIDVIRLSLDVNHDGIMEESFTGPDNTTAENPYVFWANNNYDRYTLDSDGTNYYDDDVASNSRDADDFFTGVSTPDCNFKNGAGNRIIPCERDLADFTRLWVSGVSNTLSRLPSGSTVTLSWAGNGTSPTIDLFQAADADGGIGYLTNSTIASEQIDSFYRPYIGRIGPGQSIQLNASTFSNNWAGDHFIWCGVATGNDQLNLTISDGSGNTLAQSSQYIQIVDIKQMYERWTLGDAPGATPRSNAVPAADSLPSGTTAPFQYTYDPATDTNTSYILYVHGWNMKPWEKDRFAESAFKRLYWQGYQGRFGVFRWPTGNGFSGELAITGNNPLTDPHNYDNSEFTAWKSAAGLLNKLASLNAQYPGHVYMLAHSMGNVVAGEALRLAGTNQILNTYVAGQGAIPAHVYDSTVSNLIDFTHANSSIPGFFTRSSYGPDTPNIYTNWLTGNSAAVGRRINSYNQNDYALSPDNWCFDQELKPDGALTWQYHYQGTINDSLAQAQTNFYKTVFNGDLPTFFNLSFVSQRYEVMAYAAESRSGALGTTPITTMDGSLNLTTVWPTDASGRSYRDHFWHSAEFRGDCWQEWNYWQIVLRSPTLGFNITN